MQMLCGAKLTIKKGSCHEDNLFDKFVRRHRPV